VDVGDAMTIKRAIVLVPADGATVLRHDGECETLVNGCIANRNFPSGMDIIFQHTYGRFIFTEHESLAISYCHFGAHQ